MADEPASSGGGGWSIDTHAVTAIGRRFVDHAEDLKPHAEKLKNADLASAYGPWSQAAQPLEGRVKEIGGGVEEWAGYCGSYGGALRKSAELLHDGDEDAGRKIRDVPASGA